MTSREDPLGYYAQLGVSPNASSSEIKAAFRRRAKELHPDKNPSPHAKSAFQRLQEAYRVTSDAEARARYDTLGVEQATSQQVSHQSEDVPEPIACASCSRVTGQPRYVIFYQVTSFVLLTLRNPVQGIFCSACAEKKAYRATALTWLLGWWGFPWGPIYSVQAIGRNLLGGTRPPDVNARLLAYQAWAFAVAGQIDLARAVAADALNIADAGEASEDLVKLRTSIRSLLDKLDNGQPAKRLRSHWPRFGRPFVFQSAPLAALALAITVLVAQAPPHSPSSSRAPQLEASSPPSAAPSISPPAVTSPPRAPIPRTFNVPVQDIPRNGWLRRPGQQPQPEGMLAPFKIVTSPGSPHYFLKVVDWQRGHPLVLVFIRSGQSVEIEVPLGSYRIKYAAGTVWYGERHLFGPDTVYSQADKRFDFAVDGDTVSGFTMELIKQRGGNLRESRIASEDF